MLQVQKRMLNVHFCPQGLLWMGMGVGVGIETSGKLKAAKKLQESWSILSHDTQKNGVFGGYLQRSVVMLLFWQSETVMQSK